MNTLRIAPDTAPAQFISLHDSRVTGIHYSDDSITFEFDDGFDRIEDDQLHHVGTGAVTFEGCTIDDFFCYKIRCKPGKNGLRLRGREINIKDLDHRFFAENKYIEVFTELYSENHMFWRGALYPQSKLMLSKSTHYIVFETMGRFPMIFTWKEIS